MKLQTHSKISGSTLTEALCAGLIVTIFFASVFELNAVCLRYIDSTKEEVAALQAVQDRGESLRNLAFSDLTTTSYVQNLMATAANSSDFCGRTTETVAIKAFPTANGVTQFTRAANGTVTTNSVATSLGSTLVQIDISTTWNMTLGGRSRSETTSLIVSNGTKK